MQGKNSNGCIYVKRGTRFLWVHPLETLAGDIDCSALSDDEFAVVAYQAQAQDYREQAEAQRALAAEPDKTTMQREYHYTRELQFREQHEAAKKLAAAARLKLIDRVPA